jgi:fructose-1,6-bisphosphatase/inositol monophosphatase family enzyme
MHDRELATAIRAAQRGARVLAQEAARPGGPRGSGSFADVDGEIADLLCDAIRSEFPNDAIVCEDITPLPGTSRRTFWIDPHDGTSSFLRGSRETSISVALAEEDRLLLGVVLAPFPGRLTGPDGLLVTWAEGRELERNGRRVRAGEPNDVVLVSAQLSDRTFESNRARLKPMRLERCASIATRLALVAIGEAQLAITVNTRLAPWDFAGGQALLIAAGGNLVGSGGNPVRWIGADVHSDDRALPGYFGARDVALAQEAATLFCDLYR